MQFDYPRFSKEDKCPLNIRSLPMLLKNYYKKTAQKILKTIQQNHPAKQYVPQNSQLKIQTTDTAREN